MADVKKGTTTTRALEPNQPPESPPPEAEDSEAAMAALIKKHGVGYDMNAKETK
jgi:hypothetical protein